MSECTEWERQVRHVNRLLDSIAEMPASPADTIFWDGLSWTRVDNPTNTIRWGGVSWPRAELVRLLNGVLYERFEAEEDAHD